MIRISQVASISHAKQTIKEENVDPDNLEESLLPPKRIKSEPYEEETQLFKVRDGIKSEPHEEEAQLFNVRDGIKSEPHEEEEQLFIVRDGNSSQFHQDRNQNNVKIEADQSIKFRTNVPPQLTKSEQMKLYWQRKKMAQKNNLQFGEFERDKNSQTNSNMNFIIPPQTAAERMRRYRERKKKEKQQNQPSCPNEADIKVPDLNTQIRSKPPPKTGAERNRAFRERKKKALEEERKRREEKIKFSKNPMPSNESTNQLLLQSNGDSDSSTEIILSNRYEKADREFSLQMTHNEYGFSCTVCDRLWFKNDLKNASFKHESILRVIVENFTSVDAVQVCSTCRTSLDKDKIPIMSVYNGFKYATFPNNLPPLDLITARLVSPRIPFMQIRRLRHINGQYGVYGQIINVPVSVNTMVYRLPRDISDEHCVYVHIKRKKIYNSSFVHGLVDKLNVKAWLTYLINTPLYKFYNITVDESFFGSKDKCDSSRLKLEDVSEHISIKESLVAQQQSLLWNDEKFLRIVPAEHNSPISLLFDEHTEELSFPDIYVGHFRKFREGITATPFQIATSELRRTDRRGVTPHHLLYMAMKILRLRVSAYLTIAFKHVGHNAELTKAQVESDAYINDCIESNLAFLKSIPNSLWYWAQRKRDLFAMMRQLGKPSIFLTFSANEIGWKNLIKLLYKLNKNNGVEISDKQLSELSYIQKSTLINEDAVTCAIYFNKLVNILMSVLQSKKCSPFGRHRVLNYYERIEFQHTGSPHAHILLWLDNAPKDILGADYNDAIQLIDQLISVSSDEAQGHINLQKHHHTFTCYKKSPGQKDKCRFNAPFMPSRSTVILTPMQKHEENFAEFANRYEKLRESLESNDFESIDDFYNKNDIKSDDDYNKILRAGITKLGVFIKRLPNEKWFSHFNPWLLGKVQSNMDIQLITEEYSCAQYVVEYVNKSKRGMSNLQRQIINVMDENTDFDVVEITKKLSVDIINTAEMCSQEAAWFLLREPMSKSSIKVTYIPTLWPVDRQRIRKTQKELDELDDDSAEVWREDWFDKYEKRPTFLKDVTLAQFVSKYTINQKKIYVLRKKPGIIRYRNYDMNSDLNDYKREMVTLHIPFCNEEQDILTDMKFIEIYNQNEALILNRRKEFESNFDIDKTIQICEDLIREEESDCNDNEDLHHVGNEPIEQDPFQHCQLYGNYGIHTVFEC